MSTTLASADVLAPTVAAPSRRVATGAALLALACILGLVEAALPSVPLAPWLHLGLANVAVVVALALSGAGVAAVVSLGRVLIVGLATGSLASPPFAMAATGALASLAVMWALAVGVPSLSVVGWSAAGSAAHVLGQFFVAAALLGSDSLLVLAPPSVLLALLLGAVVGTLARTAVSLIASG